MKWIPVSALVFVIVFHACSRQDPAPAVAAGQPQQLQRDTDKVIAIEQYVKVTVNQSPSLLGGTSKVKLYSEKDFVGYGRENGKLVTGFVNYFKDNTEVRNLYYLKDSTIVYYKHRYFRKTNNPFALELICYLENNKIFHAVERSFHLPEGESPLPLLDLPLQESKANKDSLGAVISAEWNHLKSVIDTLR